MKRIRLSAWNVILSVLTLAAWGTEAPKAPLIGYGLDKTGTGHPKTQYIHGDSSFLFNRLPADLPATYKPEVSDLVDHMRNIQRTFENTRNDLIPGNLLIARLVFLTNSTNSTTGCAVVSKYLKDGNKVMSFIPGSTPPKNAKQNPDYAFVESSYLCKLLEKPDVNSFFPDFQKVYAGTCYAKPLATDGSTQKLSQQLHHTEHWFTLFLQAQIIAEINRIFQDNEQISELYGIMIPFYSWRDVCRNCQEIFPKRIPDLIQKVKAHFQNSNQISETFFILPIAFSTEYYSGFSKTRNPRTLIPNFRKLLPGSVQKTAQYNFIQHTQDYQRALLDSCSQKAWHINNFLGAHTRLPCIWFPAPADLSLSTLDNKIKHSLLNGELRQLAFNPSSQYFDTIGTWITQFRSLEKIDLSHNSLTQPQYSLVAQALATLTHLQELNLSCMALTCQTLSSFTESLFPSLQKLKSLNLSGNRLFDLTTEVNKRKTTEQQILDRVFTPTIQQLIQALSPITPFATLSLERVYEPNKALMKICPSKSHIPCQSSCYKCQLHHGLANVNIAFTPF
jgi:hypothetical protein